MSRKEEKPGPSGKARICDRMGLTLLRLSYRRQALMLRTHLHDWYVCVRGGMVEDLWAISARGALL
jgi:hypothetical protein